ncbi:T9SS type A sorting domain-containing protein [Subsaximicrobium wynnwilliamsii]|uniref:T9SS type A sorting domain-containing protein n=1 Tax=Subsaximicrobium wynnwilliamsii TaxID=291179 RepID=A0A5C6ZJG5_9FLAO|nr:T9SS type A sorting domain-containing protein [Subsaximicrobium wynnwilliamsii]TXD83661.1 T9SS type A sorting domain-containing protein [Subsaximicrobium wynnwilliamsii]TXD89454.1 T9SS type A sorting domain-containing protein [Subsaximicrobium wynnwilliamsii]TXE03498.1 T9SS type A sorting domain-containing protein [Subsaximicrobium wynnwilliamsii]
MKKLLLFIVSMTLALTAFSQSTYTVNTTDDLPDININDTVCADANGNCTFRAALQNANKTSNKDTIEFNISGSAPITIAINFDILPNITQPIIIDGRTQAQYAINNTPVIEILNEFLQYSDGIKLYGNSTGSELYGLCVVNFARMTSFPFNFGCGIISNTANHIIQSNYIGLRADGTTLGGNTGGGVSLVNLGGHLIGGIEPFQGNVISGNPSFGLNIGGSIINSYQSFNNVIQGNLFGTDATGTLNRGNRFNLQIVDSYNNTIGGNTPAARNIISGAKSTIDATVGTGLAIEGPASYGNKVIGNYIGTDITGTQSISNVRGGVLILFGANNNDIGTDIAGEGNVISGNGQYGVYLQGDVEIDPVDSNSIKGNYIGVDATGNAPLPNSLGIAMIFGVNNNNTVGGTTPNSKNVISGNTNAGIAITNGNNNQIIGNYIGTDASGTTAITNTIGISVKGGNTSIGGQGAASRNIISGNDTGLEIGENATIATVVKGNYIGLNALGTAAIPNTRGIWLLLTSTNSVIGGTNVLDRNIISGNSFGIFGEGSFHSIKNNYIGLNPSGTSAIPNAAGISFVSTATNTTIGGATALDRNIISGNSNFGIFVSGTSHTIQNNYIGLNSAGTAVIKNNNIGMRLFGTLTNTQISENTISGNGTVSSSARNVEFNSANGAHFFSNKVGTLPDGNTAVTNIGNGVVLATSSNNNIGGVSEIEGNIIGNHNLSGVLMAVTSSNNTFSHNNIGLGLDGVSDIGNGAIGILIIGSNTGNTIVNNTIANNQQGLVLDPAAGIPTQVTISENSIYNNSNLGIDLIGTTANDADDADAGVNNLQNTPEISTINFLGGTAVEITYAVPSAVTNSAYPLTIEFFGAINGQGKFFIESDTYAAPGSKTVTINLPAGFDSNDYLTLVATATDANGNTSEFGISTDSTLSVSQFENTGFKVYPNPVSNILFVKSPASESYSLRLSNALGQVVSTKKGELPSMSLDVTNLSKGLYFLNIDSENGNSKTIKFIKN